MEAPSPVTAAPAPTATARLAWLMQNTSSFTVDPQALDPIQTEFLVMSAVEKCYPEALRKVFAALSPRDGMAHPRQVRAVLAGVKLGLVSLYFARRNEPARADFCIDLLLRNVDAMTLEASFRFPDDRIHAWAWSIIERRRVEAISAAAH